MLVDVFGKEDLQTLNYLEVFAPDSSFCNYLGFKPRFVDGIDLELRLEYIERAIDLLNAERNFLYHHSLEEIDRIYKERVLIEY